MKLNQGTRSKKSTSRQLAELALVQARGARLSAHAPYSKFKVGAALQTDQGQVFTGCNVENASYGGTICAERVAFLKAVSEGATRFDAIVVVAKSKHLVPPCALCLQTMAEFCDSDFVVHLAMPTGGIQKSYQLKELLPYPFNSKHL